MALKLKTAPGVTPITVAEAKTYLRQDSSDQDSVITLLISDAVELLDGHRGILGRCMISQVWELYYDSFPSGDLQIPLGNLISVDSVDYVDPVTGLLTAWAASNYEVDTVPVEGWVIPKTGSWPTPKETSNAVRITFTAGFGANAAAVPAPLRAALLQIVAHNFRNREAVMTSGTPIEVPLGAASKIAPYRRIQF
jgi:uncharacterized phiE125 gp8 family phage protein